MVVYSEFYSVYGIESCLPNTPPSPIAIESLNAASSQMVIAFDTAFNNAVRYRYERRLSGGAWGAAQIASSSVSGSRINATDVGLVAQTTYCFRIVAINRFGETTGPEACKSTARGPLPIPTDLRITSAAAYQVQLAWTDNAVDEASYQVTFKRENGSNRNVISLPANAGVGPMTATIKNEIQPDTNYCFTVIAIADNADSNPGATVCGRSAPATGVSQFIGAPTAIQFCTSTPVNLNWTVRAAENTILSRNGIKVFQRTNPNGLADWTDTFTDTTPFDGASGDTTYVISLQANGPNGNPSANFVIRAVTQFPIYSVIVVVNNSYESVHA